ncbi:methyltransferase domain-containing protein [Gynuella sp.]|uniref:methyltransferase domain-containing protein n=1 Tax=Gynuella sp. TaxID=2969146 RepID=UPI003D0E3454
MKQVSHEISSQVLEQYDSPQGRAFYQQVMGDSGFNIHYGIYPSENETMKTASENIIRHLLELAQQRGVHLPQASVLDLGSGTGGAAHYLAEHFGCQVTCVNISPEQNKINRKQAQELGIDDLIKIEECSFDHLPENWSGQFDLVWSEEAFCHAEHKDSVIKEAWRVLKPGGVLVFSDIMEGMQNQDTHTFSDRNAIRDLASPSDYIRLCMANGFYQLSYQDLSHHLPINFRKMIDQIDQNYDRLVENGVSSKYADNFRQSLNDRVNAAFQGNFSWGSFVMNKSTRLEHPHLRSVIEGRNLCRITAEPLTRENLDKLGTLYAYDQPQEQHPPVPQHSWPVKYPQRMETGRGLAPLGTDDMTMTWQQEVLHARNKVLKHCYENIAYRDEQHGYFIEWFNQHVESGQKFYCPGVPLLYVLAAPGDHPKAQDFKAFIADGSHGVIINPGVWHTNPIPLIDTEVTLTTTQSIVDASCDYSLSAENNQWLNIVVSTGTDS